ncbi:alpha/beta hydrolase [Chitinasiproducens palmae]|uniref:Alpha/beta hydrolase fold n=1 Tax=Chitinasiproducens palmae TaxID=1770053 RepID=A0A1H2PJX5_9BURK|nr:alpha/beta hydrolase [Chitinasiproducens palmae]SDV46676.1 alpha/beta hydrolase fold [Chitinasiproducens palmae]
MKTTWKAFSLAALLLTGCGGHDVPIDNPTPTPDPLDTYRKQAVSWTTCATEQLGNYTSAAAQLGSALQCAQIVVPTDYSNPEGSQLTLSLMRVSAPDTANHQGSILINPGGPGADGLREGLSLALILRDVSPDNPLYTGLYQMSQRYDLVGFSPRGTVNASQLNCALTESEKFVAFLGEDRSASNLANAIYNVKLAADACKANPLTPFINTDTAARDLDIIRSVLNESKLDYLGYSYGTALGTWYARLFPENVGKMMLDGTVDIERPLALAVDADQAVAAQVVLDQVIAPYAASLSSVFDVGATVDEVRAIVPNAPIWAKQYVANNIYLPLGVRSLADNVVIVLAAVRGITEILATEPGLDGTTLRDRIASHRFATSDLANALVAQKAADASAYLDLYAANGAITTTSSSAANEVIPAESAVNIVVKCNDAPVSQDTQYWIDLGNSLLTQAPLYGGGTTANPCLSWGTPSVQKPSITGAQQAPAMLMVQGQYDPKTPLAGAQRTLGYLPKASMILVQNDNTHGIFPSQIACVDVTVGNYFAYGTQPARNTECSVPVLGASSETTATQKSSVAPQFLHPETTQERIEQRRRELQQ